MKGILFRFAVLTLTVSSLAIFGQTSSTQAETTDAVMVAAKERNPNSFGAALTVNEKLSDFSTHIQQIRAGYGPLQYKAQSVGLPVEALIKRYEDLIRASTSNADFYYLISQFVAEFKDSHFAALVPSELISILPFTTDLVGNKVVVEAVNPAVAWLFPFKTGDEVVAIDSVPVAKVVNDLMKYRGNGNELTTRRTAAMTVSVRRGRSLPVPRGAVTVTIKSRESGTTTDVPLTWITRGEAIDEDLRQRLSPTALARDDFNMISISERMADIVHPDIERSFMCSGSTRIQIPENATLIMDKPFVAYYHPTAKGNIGYLRIPHYSPQNEVTGAPEYEQRLRQYQFAVHILEKNTVGLIIDQDHNCGGSVSYLQHMVSLFTNKPFAPLMFQLRATKPEYLAFRSWARAETEFTLDQLGVARVAKLILNSWQSGQFLTPKTAIDGNEVIFPNPVNYTKPIVMLVDELSGSGGDAFPSMMQGMGRARLVGTQTMGAGGHVQEVPPLPLSGIRTMMTRSLFYRPDGVAVENNGAVPLEKDRYQITIEDYVGGYKQYQKFYLDKLFEAL